MSPIPTPILYPVLERRVARKGARPAPAVERRGALVCIRSTDAPALVAALAADGVVTSERDSNLRVSAHAYNTAEDVDALLGSLAKHRSLLAR